jgi:transposase-like protein
MGTTGQQVRAELKRAGRPYPERARRRAIAYAEEERERGVGVRRIAKELGISPITLASWLRGGVLRRVEIVADSPPATKIESSANKREIVATDTRSGVRIEGLDLDALVALMERLR